MVRGQCENSKLHSLWLCFWSGCCIKIKKHLYKKHQSISVTRVKKIWCGDFLFPWFFIIIMHPYISICFVYDFVHLSWEVLHMFVLISFRFPLHNEHCHILLVMWTTLHCYANLHKLQRLLYIWAWPLLPYVTQNGWTLCIAVQVQPAMTSGLHSLGFVGERDILLQRIKEYSVVKYISST